MILFFSDANPEKDVGCTGCVEFQVKHLRSSWAASNVALHFALRSVTPVATKGARDIAEFCSVNMDA